MKRSYSLFDIKAKYGIIILKEYIFLNWINEKPYTQKVRTIILPGKADSIWAPRGGCPAQSWTDGLVPRFFDQK